MGVNDAREQLEAAIEEVGRLEREVALLRAERDAALELVAALRAEKDSPHADAKYWLELQEARAEIAEASAGWAANGVLVGEARAERDDALKRIAALMSHLEHWDAEHDRAVRAEALEEAANAIGELLALGPITTRSRAICDAQDAVIALRRKAGE